MLLKEFVDHKLGNSYGSVLIPRRGNSATLFPIENAFPSIGIGEYGQPKKIITYRLDRL